MRLAAALLGLSVLLVGCGGSSEPPEIGDLAAELDCEGLDSGGTQMFVREIGSCVIDGQDVYLHTFSNDDDQSQWIEVGSIAGGGGVLVKGDLWVAQVFDAATADVIAEAGDAQVIN